MRRVRSSAGSRAGRGRPGPSEDRRRPRGSAPRAGGAAPAPGGCRPWRPARRGAVRSPTARGRGSSAGGSPSDRARAARTHATTAAWTRSWSSTEGSSSRLSGRAASRSRSRRRSPSRCALKARLRRTEASQARSEPAPPFRTGGRARATAQASWTRSSRSCSSETSERARRSRNRPWPRSSSSPGGPARARSPVLSCRFMAGCVPHPRLEIPGVRGTVQEIREFGSEGRGRLPDTLLA